MTGGEVMRVEIGLVRSKPYLERLRDDHPRKRRRK